MCSHIIAQGNVELVQHLVYLVVTVLSWTTIVTYIQTWDVQRRLVIRRLMMDLPCITQTQVV